MTLHVDDFLAAGKKEELDKFINELKIRYSVKCSPAKLCLGIEICRPSNHSILLSQEQYIAKTLAELNLVDIKVRHTPMAGGVAEAMMSATSGAKLLDPLESTLYRSIFGKLMYAMVATRPDISFVVGLLGRYLLCPTTLHLSAAKSVLGYLKGTLKVSLQCSRGSDESKLPLQSYVDSDFASTDNRRSTTGYVCFLGDTPITWCSQKQSVVATSTTEAEYIALFEATKEVVWLRRLIYSLGYPCGGATTIYEDNASCITLTREDAHHSRTKHLSVKFHFTRDQIVRGVICVKAVPSADNTADIFTKIQPQIRFQRDYKHLNLVLKTN